MNLEMRWRYDLCSHEDNHYSTDTVGYRDVEWHVGRRRQTIRSGLPFHTATGGERDRRLFRPTKDSCFETDTPSRSHKSRTTTTITAILIVSNDLFSTILKRWPFFTHFRQSRRVCLQTKPRDRFYSTFLEFPRF